MTDLTDFRKTVETDAVPRLGNCQGDLKFETSFFPFPPNS